MLHPPRSANDRRSPEVRASGKDGDKEGRKDEQRPTQSLNISDGWAMLHS